ncbi:1-phosphofructokinase [Muricomes intestini]|uniref:1-phosphofructokinase n=1 Tax=Muricomes intestini TaxID=1796634 RepID=UPI002FE353CD
MIATITLNPCIDRTVEIEKFLYGGTNNVLNTRDDISGKGINVNSVLQHLGIENLSTGFNYKEDAAKLTDFLKKLGCSFKHVEVNGELRTNIKIFDTEKSVMSEFNEKGHAVSKEHVDGFLRLLEDEMDKIDVLVVDGSVPPGISADIYKEIISMANQKAVKTILDASGDLLKFGIDAKPFLIKPNVDELEYTFNRKIENEEEILKTAKDIVSSGIKYVCVSRGSKGAVFVSDKASYIVDPVKVDVKGVQGAGDSMVAGFCYAIVNGLPEIEIIRHGVACATGSLIHSGTKLCRKKDMEYFLPQIKIHKL